MPTKITLIVDDQTGKGFQSMVRNTKAADRSTDSLTAKLSQFQRQSTSMIGRIDKWSLANKRVKQSLDQVAVSQNNVSTATRTASTAQGRMTKSSSSFSRGILEASRGVEDFTIQLGPAGLSGAMRGASNNLSQMAFIMGGPAVGAAAGFAIAIGTIVIPKLLEGSDATEKFTTNIDLLLGKLRGLESARLGTLGVDLKGQKKQIELVGKELEIRKRVTTQISREALALNNLIELRKELPKLQATLSKAVERNRRIRNKESMDQVDHAKQRLDNIKTEELALLRSNRVVREVLAKGGSNKEKIANAKKLKAEIQEEVKSRVTGERNVNFELEERRKILAGNEAAERKAGTAAKKLREELGELRDKDARQQRQFGIQREESQSKLNKLLDKSRDKQAKITKELEEAADKNQLDVKEREKGMKRINELQEDQLRIVRRLDSLQRQAARELDQLQRTADKEREREVIRLARVRERENQKRLQFEMNFNQQQIKNAADLEDAKAKALAGATSGQKGFADPRIQKAAQGISRGDVLLEAAKEKAGNLEGLSRGEKAKALKEAKKELRKGAATGDPETVKALGDALERLIEKKIKQGIKRDKPQIERELKKGGRQRADDAFDAKLNPAQLEQARGAVLKSSVEMGRKMGLFQEISIKALNEQVQINNDTAAVTNQNTQAVQQIFRMLKAQRNSQKRTNAQRSQFR